jgi:hypothetical protein
MLYLKESPMGIDIPIQRIQNRINATLIKTWGLRDGEYNCFGRVYRNQRENAYIPEVYVGNSEYRETFYDDRVPATSFFSVSEIAKGDLGWLTSNISLIFCVNLERIKPNIRHRADEEAHFDVLGAFQGLAEVESVITGISNVFRDFSAQSIKFTDMHPFHCFRINMSVGYNKCQ